MIVFIPRDRSKLIKQIAAVVSGAQLLLAIYLWKIFDQTVGTFQFMERAEWIPSFNITYILGVDGLSLPMVFLMALIGFIGIFVSWNIDKDLLVQDVETVNNCKWPQWSMANAIHARLHGIDIQLENQEKERALMFKERVFMT